MSLLVSPFAQLHQFLADNSSAFNSLWAVNDDRRELITVEQSHVTSAQVLVQYLLKQCNTTKRKVVLIAGQFNFEHYALLMRGVSVQVDDATNTPSTSAVSIVDVKRLMQLHEDNALPKLLHERITATCGDLRPVLIFDNVAALLDCGLSLADCTTLVQQLPCATLITVVDSHEEPIDESEYSRLTQFCRNLTFQFTQSCLSLADARVRLRPVGSGYNKDVTGEIVLSSNMSNNALIKNARLLYHVGERQVRFFQPGRMLPI